MSEAIKQEEFFELSPLVSETITNANALIQDTQTRARAAVLSYLSAKCDLEQVDKWEVGEDLKSIKVTYKAANEQDEA